MSPLQITALVIGSGLALGVCWVGLILVIDWWYSSRGGNND
jgi:hypothetical protein